MNFKCLFHSNVFRLGLLLLVWLLLMLALANSELDHLILPPPGDWRTPGIVTLTPTPSTVPGWWSSLPTPIPLRTPAPEVP